MEKKDREEMKKRLIDFLSNQKWIMNLEKRVEKQLKSARVSFDKNFEKAKKSLNITTKKDINSLQSKIKALEKRIEKLEGIKKPKSSKPKTSAGKTEG
ncbi:MAG: hypothetical protein HYW01_01785 [Deltaproteobacteria bacterium]|nr:hypothetical protein [Deltaproteobacteria bacterium]